MVVDVDVVVALLGTGADTLALEAGIKMKKIARREKTLDANLAVAVAARCRRQLGGRDMARKGRQTGAKWKTQVKAHVDFWSWSTCNLQSHTGGFSFS